MCSLCSARILRYKGFRLFDEDILDSEAEKRGAIHISQVGGVNLAEKFGKELERISEESFYSSRDSEHKTYCIDCIFHGFSLFRKPDASNMHKNLKETLAET